MEICSENYCSVSSEWISVKTDWALVDWQRWLENHALNKLHHMWRCQFYYIITLLLYQWAYIISTDWYTWRFKKTQSLTNQSWLSSTLTHPIQEPNFGLWMSCSDNIFNSTVIKMLKNDDHGRFMTELCCFFKKKNALYLSVNVSSMKVLIGDTIFKSPTGGVYAIFRGHLSYAKVHPPAVQREYLHFSVILRPWVMVRPQESSPRPPALQSSTLPTMLILPKFKV